MKSCSACKRSLPEDSFTKNSARKDGLNHSCKTCHHAYLRNHYKRNRTYYVNKARANEREIRAVVKTAKNKPCADCGGTFHFAAMDFDHVRGKKRFNPSQTKVAGSIRSMIEELSKCDVVCSNCHRVRTWNRIYGHVV